MEVKTGIYKITSPSNKIYIGQSININKRFSDYLKDKTKYSNQKRLLNSINKYGVNNHIFDIIEICNIEDLNKKERYWQEHYDVININGLNCKLQKTTDKSGKLSEFTKEAIRNSNLGQKRSEASKLKMSINNGKPQLGKKGNLSMNFGKKASNETKQKMSNSHKNRIRNNSKKVICTDTFKIWDSVNLCAKELGISIYTLYNYISKRRINVTNFKYYENE